MAQYNHKFKSKDQHVTIAWLIVLFAVVIMFLIWRAHGVF